MGIIDPYHRGWKRGTTEYGHTWDQIVAITLGHMRAGGALIRSMIEVRDRYNAEWVLPGFEELGNLSPMIVADAVDGLGMTAAQVDPAIYCPPIDEGKLTGVKSQEYATIRRKILGATLHASGYDVARGRFFRHLAGYATGSKIAKPDWQAERMAIHVRDPLTTYAEPKDPEDLSPPRYVCYVYGRSAKALRDEYPMLAAENGGPITRADIGRDVLWDVVEWWDADAVVIGVLGPRLSNTDLKIVEAPRGAREIYRVPNRIMFVPAVCPSQVTLDRIQSAVFRIIGSSDLMSRLRALDILASEKAVFPDRYVIGREGMTPRLVAGRWIDGREGETNLVVDATALGEMRSTPDPSGKIAHDRVEGEAKRHVGLTGQMQGDHSNALRTGRALDSLAGYSIDPRVAEFHRIAQHSDAALNRAVLTGYKRCFGSKQFSMYSGWNGDGMVRFKPDTHIEEIEPAEYDEETGEEIKPEQLAVDNAVVYPIPGADVLNTTMALSQMKAGYQISLRTLRERHPWIPDAEREGRQVLVEEMEARLWDALAQRMAPGGGMHPVDAAEVVQKIRETGDIVEATKLADTLAAQRQAAEAPAPEVPGLPPETQPGIGMEGEGREMQLPTPQDEFAPTDPQSALRRLTLALKTNPSISA